MNLAMRFAYIDSQGNEVPIPSVDALAIRIELGAIGADTQLYDGQADRWGPAHTHEIYHTLARDGEDTEGFVAPPPPAVADDLPENSVEGGAPTSSPQEPFFDLAAEIREDTEAGAEPPAASDMSGAEGDDGVALDFTLAELPPSATVDPYARKAPEEDEVEVDPENEKEVVLSADEPEVDPTGAEPGGSGLDLEVPLDEMDFSGREAVLSGGIDLAEPHAEFSGMGGPLDPVPASERDDAAMDFSRTRSALEKDDEPQRLSTPGSRVGRKREPRSRPSPPRRVRRRSPAGFLLGTVAIAAIVGGGLLGWRALRFGQGSEPAGGGVPALPPVTIPEIPIELLPQMRELGEAALASTVAELEALQAEFEIPVEPREDWLAGVYLANASQFGDIAEYWQTVRAYVDRVRSSDTEVFHGEYVKQLEAAGVTGETASLMLARADSGFLSTRSDRAEAYTLMDNLVNASLDLHGFLLLNEPSITHEPAAGGVSRDPVLEAVPSTPELGSEMWEMVDRITAALDALGTLDRVTTERLLSVLLDRVQRAAFE